MSYSQKKESIMTKRQCFAGAITLTAMLALSVPAMAQGALQPQGAAPSAPAAAPAQAPAQTPALAPAPSRSGGGAAVAPRGGGGQVANSGRSGGNRWDRGGRRHRHHGGYYRGYGYGAGLAFGAVPYYYGSPGYYYDEPEVYYESGPASSGSEIAYCRSRFKSYDPASGTYLGYDGQRHPCP